MIRRRSRKRQRAPEFVSLLLYLGCALSLVGAEDPPQVPDALKTWASDAYPMRYFLKVKAPPLAGAINLQPIPTVAHVFLPLKCYEPQTPSEGKESKRVENILLVGEDGVIQPVFVRPVKGGSEVEVAFPTRSAFRRFCLYAGAKDGYARDFSPPNYRPHRLQVRLLGQLAPSTFRPKSGELLTRQRFQELPRSFGRLGETRRPFIDDPEPPFKRGLRENYVARYEAFLRTPVRGKYDFAVSTFGAAVLQVDEVELASAGQPDPKRKPFAITGSAELHEGLHRVTVYHAQAGELPGVRLHWRTPFQKDFLTVPSQIFGRALPGVVTNVEKRDSSSPGFIHVEKLGHCRTRLHRGPERAREWVLVAARSVGTKSSTGQRLRFRSGESVVSTVDGSAGSVWMPAEVPVTIERVGEGGSPQSGGTVSRTVSFPLVKNGARYVLDVTGELILKAAPTFLFPDEVAQLHFEVALSPLPVIRSKKRIERGPAPPPALPYGDFRLTWRLTGSEEALRSTVFAGERIVTPERFRCQKIRIPLEVAKLSSLLRSGETRAEVALTVGGVPVEKVVFRLLHSRYAWPKGVAAGLDSLSVRPEGEPDAAEHVMIVVPREKEAGYRRFRLPGTGGPSVAGGKQVLFLGAPLAEASPEAGADAAFGLPACLEKEAPDKEWSVVSLPGPHRGWFVFRMLAGAEAWATARKGRIPERVVVSVGGGDARCQTPLYQFERGLDVLVDRLRQAGARWIFFLGVVPEPGRRTQGQAYQGKWAEVVRQHHLPALDVFTLWTQQKDWMKRFSIDPGKQSAFGPTPDAKSLEELAEEIAKRMP